jgi:two-component system phosphate regulon sensor histidine kinase PhoR
MLLLITACLVIGLISGYYGWSLAAGLGLYLGWTLKQLLRLHEWLRLHQPDEAPPDGYGLWGEVFDSIYHLQRRDQRVRGRLQAVIDRVQESTAALKDAVIMLDSDGNLEWWNRAAETLLGLKTPQDSGQPVTNLVRHPRFKEYFEQENYAEPLEIPSPTNDRVRMQLYLTRYGNNEHLMLVRDVTRIHQLEQMRKDFVANVSHELRTPLTVICGYLETLLDNVEDVNPRWSRALQQMQQQGGRMQTLLNDLLLLAKLEATDYPSDNQPVAVDACCSRSRTTPRLSGQKNQRITLEADPRSCSRAAKAELRSAFSNLVFNAVKYTQAEGNIRIRWWGDDQGAPERAGLRDRHRRQAPAAPDRTLLPRRLQPQLQHRRHRAGPGDRQACAAAPPRTDGNQQRAGAWQHLHLPFRPGPGGHHQCQAPPAALGNRQVSRYIG